MICQLNNLRKNEINSLTKMIRPAEIKLKSERKYLAYLQSVIRKENIFPLFITGNKKPSASLQEFRNEISRLIDSSKEKKGSGYTITFEKRKTKSYGTQSFPTSIYFSSENDYLKYLKKNEEVKKFITTVKLIESRFPELQGWIERYPNKILDNLTRWDEILKVCKYFKDNPKPELYIRELPIEVHTKFIEHNKTVIKELLDIIIQQSINSSEIVFEKRFNLKFSEPLIRFKILDSTIAKDYFSGLSDISIPINQFCKLVMPIEKVIIVENKTSLYTTLTLPLKENSIAIFGKGFQVSSLKKANWLGETKIFYWGDIDVQGFEILSQVRGYFPQTKSVLMDKGTFEKYFEDDEGTVSNVSVELNLTENEKRLYTILKENNWRLEQEKIPLNYVIESIVTE